MSNSFASDVDAMRFIAFRGTNSERDKVVRADGADFPATSLGRSFPCQVYDGSPSDPVVEASGLS